MRFLRPKWMVTKLNWFRWSLAVCLFLYSVLFALVKIYQIPPTSVDRVTENPKQEEERNGKNRLKFNDDIVEYLHRLHKAKGNGNLRGNVSRPPILEPFNTIEEVFKKADSNVDNYLTSDEIAKWIHHKTQEHIHRAIMDNYKTFMAIDVRPKNGYVSWDEYYRYFLGKNGYNSTALENSGKTLENWMSRRMRETIMRDRAAFSESAKKNPNHLDLDEFLSFTHPESSYSTIIYLVDEIYSKFDVDSDGILTEDEFSSLQTEEGDEDKSVIPNLEEEEERRKEFREMVDLDKDGKATRKELLTYVDPKNPRHAREEAEILVDLADINKDGRLSLLEIFNKMDLFLESKMINIGRSFHDEL